MSRFGGWLRASVKGDSNDDSNGAAVAAAEKERRDLADSLAHAQLIINDDVDGAYTALRKGDSSFHRLGAAVAFFMRSVLGMEKQVMAETVDMLNNCETKAWDDFKAAERRGPRGESIYAPGTEYELVRAQTQLMGAVVGVLHESLMEAMKSFYKLRKAFIILDAIITIENGVLGENPASEAFVQRERMPGSFDESDGTGQSTPKDKDGETSESEDFVDAKEGPATPQTPTADTNNQDDEKTPKNDAKVTLPLRPNSQPQKTESKELTLTDPVDIFIHSGANMCFGILMLMLTLVPPSFARILSVVGFRGDRARGVQMLWRSSTHNNINGATSGMTLLSYYNGLLGTVDILPHPDDYDEAAEVVGPPREKCERLLATMRERYPDSRLWQVEESRHLSGERDLRGAIHLLTTGPPSKMKQVAALNDFELALTAMFVQDWPLMRDSFLRCAETNDWSPALYWFMAGCATLELYRDAKQSGDVDEARRQKKKAETYLRKAPTVAGKKRFMAGKLPFETFLQRKLQRWEDRAAELKIDMVDAAGASPALELCYLWNGTKKMNEEELERTAANLTWERCTCGEEALAKMKAEADEMGVWAVSMASIRRSQGRYEEARAVLEEHVMKHDR